MDQRPHDGHQFWPIPGEEQVMLIAFVLGVICGIGVMYGLSLLIPEGRSPRSGASPLPTETSRL